MKKYDGGGNKTNKEYENAINVDDIYIDCFSGQITFGPDIWVTEKGEVLKIKALTDDHLKNIIKKFGISKTSNNNIIAEAKKRNLLEEK